jgi:outer membrane protein OmpA-like peptidoglycan-associated protein/tetratricopeptide (TPR) repeat protein
MTIWSQLKVGAAPMVILMALLWNGCSFEEKIVSGPMALEFKQYAVAADFFQKDYAQEKDPREKNRLAFVIGDCYKRMNRLDLALEWYQKAFVGGYPSAALEYAFCLKQNERYDDAAAVFTRAGRDRGNPGEYQTQIQACQAAKVWREQAERQRVCSVEPVPFNGPYADFGAALGPDNGWVVTSDRPVSEKDPRYGWTGNAFSDLYAVSSTFTGPQAFTGPVNTPYNEGTACYRSDFSELFFVRCGSDADEAVQYCRIFRTEKNGNGNWSEPEPLVLGPAEANYGHPYLSPDGRALLFSSDMADGYGGFDLYITFRLNEGGWSEPRNLGNGINTLGHEKFPFLDADTLYFASDGHLGMGGLDIFKAIKLNGKFVQATNLKAPVNSGADDFGLVVDRRSPYPDSVLLRGVFASARKGGKGNDDLYRFELRLPPPVPVQPEKTPIAYSIFVDGLTRETLRKDPENPGSPIVDYRALSEVAVAVETEDTAFVLKTPENGAFSFQLAPDRDYRFSATRNGYLSGKALLTTRGLVQDPDRQETRLSVLLDLDKIIKNREIVLENIYYDFDQWAIREDAKPTLNALSVILKENPGIRIELGSHTDCRGNDTYNLTLSQRRAESAVAFLVAQGISADRLTARGYGETAPVDLCPCRQCTDEQHQKNRRTTFKIVE